jgi:hypothetical protein
MRSLPLFLALPTLACMGFGTSRPPAGPAPTGRVTLPGDPDRTFVFEDGAAVFAVGDTLVGATAAGVVWTQPGPFSDWSAAGGPDTVVTTTPEVVLVLDAKTGATRLRVPFPALPAEDEWSKPPPPRVYAGAQVGAAWWLVDSEARFWEVTLGEAPAVRLAFQLPDESVDESTLLYDAASDTFLFEEYGQVRRLGRDGQTRFGAYSHDSVGVDGTRVAPDGGVVTLVDGELTHLAPSCAGDFAPSKWPHPGELVSRDDDEVPDLKRAAPGCVTWSTWLEDLDPVAPLLLGDLVVTNGEKTRAFRGGAVAWEAEVGASGTPVAGPDGEVLVLSSGFGDDEPWTVVALDPVTGAARWASPVTTAASPWLHGVDEIVLTRAGRWVVAGYRSDVAWLPL